MNNLMDLGGGVGFWGTLLIGILAGYIAEKVMKTQMGLIMNLIYGIVGSYLGGFIANALGLHLGEFFHGWFWGNLIVAAAGAMILIFIMQMLRNRRA